MINEEITGRNILSGRQNKLEKSINTYIFIYFKNYYFKFSHLIFQPQLKRGGITIGTCDPDREEIKKEPLNRKMKTQNHTI